MKYRRWRCARWMADPDDVLARGCTQTVSCIIAIRCDYFKQLILGCADASGTSAGGKRRLTVKFERRGWADQIDVRLDYEWRLFQKNITDLHIFTRLDVTNRLGKECVSRHLNSAKSKAQCANGSQLEGRTPSQQQTTSGRCVASDVPSTRGRRM